MQINLDLNAAVAQFQPWDLSVTVDGKSYATKPLTLADRQILATSTASLRAVVPTLLNEPPAAGPADVASWSEEVCAAVVAAVITYRDELSRKNSQAVATLVATAMNPARAGGAGR
ncbi:MAG: hypothetical protein WBD40_03580 [Tepidisphaeraceae bacterium]